MSSTWDPWSYRESVFGTTEVANLVGYRVHAIDGEIGKIDEATYDFGSSQVVVDTGPWIFGRKVVLPAGVIERVDDANEAVYVDLKKDQIKDSPPLEQFDMSRDPDYRSTLGTYYGGFYI